MQFCLAPEKLRKLAHAIEIACTYRSRLLTGNKGVLSCFEASRPLFPFAAARSPLGSALGRQTVLALRNAKEVRAAL